MKRDLPARLPLICPRCRTRSERGRELYTVSVVSVDRADGDEILDGELGCDNAACGARHPIVGGLPLLVAHPEAVLTGQAVALALGDLSALDAAGLAAAGPDEAPWPQLLEHLSIYMDAHWGDRATPPADDPVMAALGPLGGFGFRALGERLAARHQVKRAVELGTSVGRGLAELARTARFAVGVELHAGALGQARRLLAGRAVEFARRASGRHYTAATVEPGDRAADNVALLLADALDPPLVPGDFDRVVAFNVFDSVRDPGRLLSVADGLCAPGGELLLASPYAFQSSIVDDAARPDAADPGAWLAHRLRGGDGLEARYTIEEEADVPWTLRRDARSGNQYAVHYLRARKGA